MKVKPRDNGIFVEPVTDFEADYLQHFGDKPLDVFVKCGATPAEVLGLVIRPKKEEKK